MTQKEVWEEYKLADICFEQLDQSVVAMAGLDAMATGRPLIANGRPEIFDAMIGAPSPICQARTPDEVCAQLEKLVFNAQIMEEVGKSSREYVSQFFSSEAAAEKVLTRLRVLGVTK
jgi:glycosyltransferase involved in cell wall biosynthesis